MAAARAHPDPIPPAGATGVAAVPVVVATTAAEAPMVVTKAAADPCEATAVPTPAVPAATTAAHGRRTQCRAAHGNRHRGYSNRYLPKHDAQFLSYVSTPAYANQTH
jgi:hypothetical protein